MQCMTPTTVRKPGITATGIPKPTIVSAATLPDSARRPPLAPVFQSMQMPNSTRGAVYERLTLVQKIATKRKCFVAERRRLADAQRQVLSIQSTIAMLQNKLRELCRADMGDTNVEDVAALEPLKRSIDAADVEAVETAVVNATTAASSSILAEGLTCTGCRDRDHQIEVLLDERDAILYELNSASTHSMCSYKRPSDEPLLAAKQEADAVRAQLQELQAQRAQEQLAQRQCAEQTRAEYADELAALRLAHEQQLGHQRRTDAAARQSAAHLLHIRSQVIAQMQAQEDAVRLQLQATRAAVHVREGELQRSLDLLQHQEMRLAAQATNIEQLEQLHSDHAELMAGVEQRMAQLADENHRLRLQFKQILECRNL